MGFGFALDFLFWNSMLFKQMFLKCRSSVILLVTPDALLANKGIFELNLSPSRSFDFLGLPFLSLNLRDTFAFFQFQENELFPQVFFRQSVNVFKAVDFCHVGIRYFDRFRSFIPLKIIGLFFL